MLCKSSKAEDADVKAKPKLQKPVQKLVQKFVKELELLELQKLQQQQELKP
jgi:hypothetical protein